MADNQSRPQLFTIILTIILCINVIVMIVGFVMLFFSHDSYGVNAASISSASALFNCVGVTLLMRWHKTGIFFSVIASLLSSITLSITCAGWLNYSFGELGFFIPYIVFAIYMIILFMLLFVKIRGESLWQQMDFSFDIQHFRHIYQLSIVILCAILLISIIVMPPSIGNEEKFDIDEPVITKIDVTEKRLDCADITIEEVVAFESSYNESHDVEQRDKRIIGRIFALKHLLLSGLMPDIHNRENLVNIFMIHVGNFSVKQQEIIDWYLSLDISQQSEWNVCKRANSLAEFKEILTNKIK